MSSGVIHPLAPHEIPSRLQVDFLSEFDPLAEAGRKSTDALKPDVCLAEARRSMSVPGRVVVQLRPIWLGISNRYDWGMIDI